MYLKLVMAYMPGTLLTLPQGTIRHIPYTFHPLYRWFAGFLSMDSLPMMRMLP